MNLKLTLIFAVVLVIVLAAYFIYDNGPSGPLGTEKPPAISKSINAAAVTRIEIRLKDGEAVSLERIGGSRESSWRLTKPIDRPADPQVVQQMLFTLTRFVRDEDVNPGRDVSTGLSDPRLEVTFHAGPEQATIRFGDPSPLNTTEVYTQVAGDPTVHLVDVGTYDAFTKPVSEIRTSRLFQFQPHRAVKIGLRNRFIVVRGKEPKVEYEESLLEKVEKEGIPGWYLVEPWREFVDPLKPGRLLGGLSQLAAKEFQPIGADQEAALKEAEDIITIHLFGREEPVTVRVAGTGPSKKERWVQVEGIDEAAVVDAELIRNLPLRRNDFRLDTLFKFAPGRLKVLTVDAKGIGKAVIERQEKQRGTDAPVTVTWSVREPAGIRVEDERVARFVGAVLNQKIEEFLGVQDLKLMNLDSPTVTVTVELKDDEPRRYDFGRTSAGAFLRRDGQDEAFQVSPALVDNLLRVELNFLHLEVFSVPRPALRMFEFEWKESGELRPRFYRMKENPINKFWEFVDPVHRNGKVNRDRVSDILTVLNYIKARAYLSRDPKRIRKLGLNEVGYGGRLRVWYDGGQGKPAEFYISRNQSEVLSAKKYYMLRIGDTAIFEVSPLLVETLQKTPVLKE